MAERAATLPPKTQPGQQQQRSQEQKKKGEGFMVVQKMKQQREDMKPIPFGQNVMEKRRVQFKSDNGLQLSKEKELDILSEGNTELVQGRCLMPRAVRGLKRMPGITCQ